MLLGITMYIGSAMAQTVDTMFIDTTIMMGNQPAHMITGFVTRYTDYDSTLFVKVFGNEDTLKLNAATQVLKKGKNVRFSDLKPDAHIAAWYITVNGQNIATKIELKPGGKTKGSGTPDTGMMRK